LTDAQQGVHYHFPEAPPPPKSPPPPELKPPPPPVPQPPPCLPPEPHPAPPPTAARGAAGGVAAQQAHHQHSTHTDQPGQPDTGRGQPADATKHGPCGQRPQFAAQHAGEHRAANGHGYKQKREPAFHIHIHVQAKGIGRRCGLWRGQLFAFDAGRHGINGRVQPTCIVARLEGGGDVLVDDALGHQVGYGPFQGFGHFNAHTAILGGHHDQQAVAHMAAAHFPAVAHALGVGGNVFGLGGGHQQHHHLAAQGLFNGCQLLAQCSLLRGIQRAGLVNDAASQRGHG
jgi:hypothetical protein